MPRRHGTRYARHAWPSSGSTSQSHVSVWNMTRSLFSFSFLGESFRWTSMYGLRYWYSIHRYIDLAHHVYAFVATWPRQMRCYTYSGPHAVVELMAEINLLVYSIDIHYLASYTTDQFYITRNCSWYWPWQYSTNDLFHREWICVFFKKRKHGIDRNFIKSILFHIMLSSVILYVHTFKETFHQIQHSVWSWYIHSWKTSLSHPSIVTFFACVSSVISFWGIAEAKLCGIIGFKINWISPAFGFNVYFQQFGGYSEYWAKWNSIGYGDLNCLALVKT